MTKLEVYVEFHFTSCEPTLRLIILIAGFRIRRNGIIYGSSLPPKPTHKDQAPHPPQLCWVFIGRSPSAKEIMQTHAKITQKSYPNTYFAFKQRELQLGQPSFHEKSIWECLPTTSDTSLEKVHVAFMSLR